MKLRDAYRYKGFDFTMTDQTKTERAETNK